MSAPEGFRIGALVRRDFRAQLDLLGVSWNEHKGWTSSIFVVRGTPEQMDEVHAFIRRVKAALRG